MNCFSALCTSRCYSLLLASTLMSAACGVSDSESADRADAREYAVHYTLQPDPQASRMRVVLRLKQPDHLLRELSFPADSRVSDLVGDGEVQIRSGTVHWHPPAGGGELEWQITVHSQRGSGAYDALLNDDWGIFRAEDIIPRARTRTLKGSESRTTMTFDLPIGWTAVSEYSSVNKPIVIDRPERRFDEPTGWIAMGKLGVRRETLAGIKVAVAGPEGHDVRRMDMLALLGWTLPELAAILPHEFPRLTIVSAGDPMWRGGLSAPASMYIHADRPMISENATSSLLHEVVHTAMPIRARDGYDWIIEGLAEYYSIELLRRGKAITEERAVFAWERQAEWSKQAETLCSASSSGSTTALAVTLFKHLDFELSRQSDGAETLDSLLPLLTGDEVDATTLASAVEQLIHSVPDALHIDNLPGCLSIADQVPEN
jgi:hypothetical protein